MKSLPTAVLSLMLLSPSAFADQPPVEKTAVSNAAVPAKSITVHEDDWTKLMSEPQRLMTAAHETFLGKKADEAAADIEKAAAYVKTAAVNATPAAEAALKKSAAELTALAVRVRNGATIGRREMADSFARANQAMAVEYHAKAGTAIKAGDAPGAGSYLNRAVCDVESAAKWAGREWEAGAKVTLQAAKDLEPKLKAGAGYAVEDVSKALTFVGEETKKLGNYLASKR
ncbi:hypothetical protein [Planctomycetes bacterium TBK1r]|uniref:YfdX protein n=1 Tax=Stieleria magnilauensis TaxID=2527963 RepID=A0ABX5XUT3_9BACT|nr:hypothetical protein TBK1r_48040 [Planctomycetes bacterium TBK1r]